MARNQTRIELHHKLEAVLGSKNVFYDPPESFKLKYPCIVYYLEGYLDTPADNITYRRQKVYQMTYISPNEEDPIADDLADLRFCTLNRPFTVSDLYHWSYTIRY